jgi:hypothetical protein
MSAGAPSAMGSMRWTSKTARDWTKAVHWTSKAVH